MATPLKYLYNKEYITLLNTTIGSFYPSFRSDDFQESIFDEHWDFKELKERMRHISTTLGLYLPQPYPEAIEILQKSFVKMNFSYGLENMIFQDFVEVYGMDELEISLNALETFTINSSSEFAIRRFLIKYPQETIKQMLLWCDSDNEHIRRLASEGSRPRLPWAIALPQFKKEPREILEILEKLKDDTSAYVRKSVANSLNDISKDNPEVVIALTKKWIGDSQTRDALLKHGCRTLLKESNTTVLELFGFKAVDTISLKNFTSTPELKMGEEFKFRFDILSPKALGKLRIEFAIYFLRKNNQHNKKVFKIAEGSYQESQKSIEKSYSFKKISTRKYYRGVQKISIIINGRVFQEAEFMLF